MNVGALAARDPAWWHRWIGHALAPSLAAYCFVLGAFGTARYSHWHLSLLAGIYLSLALAVTAGCCLMARRTAYPGALVLVAVIVGQLREQTRFPDSVAGALALATVLVVPMVRILRSTGGVSKALLRWQLLLGGVAFGVLFLGCFRFSDVMRWHLLRHNALLGTPAYYLLEPAVAEREAALFEAHRGPALAPSPAAVEPVPLPTAAPVFPHIVLILLDALRADSLAAYGGAPTLMPELNAFLESSDRFVDMQVNATWTRPSMASFFTGLLAEQHGARGVHNFLGEEFVTLAESLKGRGYKTAAFVTNHAAVGRKAGFAQGFDTFFEFPQKPYARAAEVRSVVERRLPVLAASAPLFLYLHFLDPHEPYLSGKAPRGKRRGAYLAAYAEELRYLDRELGSLLRRLETELPGPRVYVITADHGEEFFEHGQFSHGLSLYQEVLRIPFAVRSSASAGRTLDAALEQRDAYSLLLAHGGGQPVDHAAWAAGAARRVRYSSIYFSGYKRGWLRPYLRQICMRSLREASLKLIWSAYGDTYELYDLANDPGERLNLAASRPGEVRRLRQELEAAVPVWTFGRTAAATGEELDQLRALGYIQ